MRDRLEQDLAPGPLLLRDVQREVRRRRLPRVPGQTLLPPRLLQRLRAQVRELPEADHRQLHIGAKRAVAPRVLRLSGE